MKSHIHKNRLAIIAVVAFNFLTMSAVVAQTVDCNAISAYLSDFSVVIGDASQVPLVPLEICSGQAPSVHLAIKNTNGETPVLNYVGIEIEWYFENTISGPPPQLIPIGQNAYSFPLTGADPSLVNDLCGIMPYTASTNRVFKALIKVPDGAGAFCEHWVVSDELKICCPPNPFGIALSQSDDGISFVPDSWLSEANQYMLRADIIGLALPWPDAPNNDVQIDWVVQNNQGNVTNFTVNPEGSELTWPASGMPESVSGMTYICISATVSNCNCDQVTYEQCFIVVPPPQCGTIGALPVPQNLTYSGTPGLYYMCRGKDASIGIDPSTSFLNCQPYWEFMFPNTAPGTWHQTSGTSNSIHNTNILPALPPNVPPVLWPLGETCITYRINCDSYWPICCACQSNEITICLFDPPPAPIISASPNPFCLGDMTTIGIDNIGNFPTGTNFEWFHNGLPIPHTGSQLQTQVGGNYMVTAIAPCGSMNSNILQPAVCVLNAVIACPDPICPCLGETITLDGVASSSTCSQPFSYLWQADSGIQQSPSNDLPQFQHTPDANGTTYTLTITDTNGCQDVVTAFIKPCMD